MALPHLGETRSASTPTHLLHTPDAFVRAPLPGMDRATAIVHASPAIGARFAQYTAEFEAGGSLGPTQAQRFVYVLEGEIEIEVGFGETTHRLGADGYAFLPQGEAHRASALGTARAAVIEKPYVPLAGSPPPVPLVGTEGAIPGLPLMGDEDLEVRSLLPAAEAFDFAVNTMTYRPGAALSGVEVHVMEHGLLMLEGGGVYRLGDAWYPVARGDFIWMAAYCPQWFGALGKAPAKYLIYKDWSRGAFA